MIDRQDKWKPATLTGIPDLNEGIDWPDHPELAIVSNPFLRGAEGLEVEHLTDDDVDLTLWSRP